MPQERDDSGGSWSASGCGRPCQREPSDALLSAAVAAVAASHHLQRHTTQYTALSTCGRPRRGTREEGAWGEWSLLSHIYMSIYVCRHKYIVCQTNCTVTYFIHQIFRLIDFDLYICVFMTFVYFHIVYMFVNKYISLNILINVQYFCLHKFQ